MYYFLNFFYFFKNINLFILIGGSLHYNVVLVLPYIIMNPPQVYTCSPSRTPLPPPSLYHPSGSSQCTSPKHPVSNLDWQFISYMILYMFPWHSHKSSHSLPLPQSPKDCSIQCLLTVSLLLSHIQGYHYHLSKFHIYALVYSIGFSSWLTSLCIIGSSFTHIIRTDSNVFL